MKKKFRYNIGDIVIMGESGDIGLTEGIIVGRYIYKGIYKYMVRILSTRNDMFTSSSRYPLSHKSGAEYSEYVSKDCFKKIFNRARPYLTATATESYGDLDEERRVVNLPSNLSLRYIMNKIGERDNKKYLKALSIHPLSIQNN